MNCGTLAVKDLRPIGQPSALGRGTPGDVVTLKNGTFRYADAPGETDRDGENPLPTNLRVKVAECAAGVVPPTVRGVNTGLEKKYFVSSETVVNAQTGLTDVYAILKPVGTMMIFK